MATGKKYIDFNDDEVRAVIGNIFGIDPKDIGHFTILLTTMEKDGSIKLLGLGCEHGETIVEAWYYAGEMLKTNPN